MTEYRFGDTSLEVDVLRSGTEFSSNDASLNVLRQGFAQIHLEQHAQNYGHAVKIGDTWWVQIAGITMKFEKIEPGSSTEQSTGDCISPMPGKIVELFVAVDQEVKQGEPLLVLEAMKMEHKILAPQDGIVQAIHINLGQQVEQGKTLIDIE